MVNRSASFVLMVLDKPLERCSARVGSVPLRVLRGVIKGDNRQNAASGFSGGSRVFFDQILQGPILHAHMGHPLPL